MEGNAPLWEGRSGTAPVVAPAPALQEFNREDYSQRLRRPPPTRFFLPPDVWSVLVLGLLNIAKPVGVTSRDVVNQIQRLVRPAKVGHAGTLDPLASGVLVLCVGRATRLISFVQDRLKTYRGTFELGKTSDTDDLEGEVVDNGNLRTIHREELTAALPEFTGVIEQVPPAFSAVQIEGRRAYALARKGEQVDLPPREVFIASVSIVNWDFPRFELEIVCGSGTYIRSLGRDIGQRLGCGAVMTGLVRTAIGEFRLEDAVPPDELTRENIPAHLIPPVKAVAHLPSVICKLKQKDLLANGRGIRLKPESTADLVAVCDGAGDLVCVARWDSERELLMPKLVFAERI